MDLSLLNQDQKQAVLYTETNSCIIACAGSGKTRVLTTKVANLIKNNISPDEIVLVTFTKKAANEMKKRVHELIKTDLDNLIVGTFHSISLQILRKYNILDRKNIIIDQEEQKLLFHRIIEKIDLSKKEKLDIKQQIVRIYSLFNINPNLKFILDKHFFRLKKHQKYIKKIINLYQKEKLSSFYLDFDDLQIYFLKYLKSKELEKFKLKTKYLLVDEYQDINQIQYDIIKEFKCNITVVGDDAQSIYSFRGSDVKYILDFRKDYPDAKLLYLNYNYRNPPEIIEISKNIINKNINQFPKNIISRKDKVQDKIQVKGFKSKIEEAKYICDQIKKYPLNDQAVLSRTHKYLVSLEIELIKRKIPYTISGGSTLLDKAHIKDFLAYLYILVNPNSKIHWLRVLDGLSESRKNKLVNSKNIAKAVLESKKKIKKVYQKMLIIQDNLYMLIYYLIDLLSPMIKDKYSKSKERIYDLEKLRDYIFEVKNIGKFLDEINFVPELNDNKNQITLSTIHASKGLEWDIVYLIGTNNLPSHLSVKNEHQIDEERRLFYVACTRASSTLLITLSYDNYVKYDRERIYQSETSIFINELDCKLIEKENIRNIEFYQKGNLDRVIKSFLNTKGPSEISKIISNIRFFHQQIYRPIPYFDCDINLLDTFFRLLVKRILFDISPDIKNFTDYDNINYTNPKLSFLDVLEDIIKLSNLQRYREDIMKYKNKYIILERFLKKIIKKPSVITFNYMIEQDGVKTEIYILIDNLILDIQISRFNIKNYYNVAKWIKQIELVKHHKIKIDRLYFLNPLVGDLYKININKMNQSLVL